MTTVIEDPETLISRFGWPDYLVFAAMLSVSAIIGVYYACAGGKQSTTSEFLMAGRSMSTFPVAMSLIASFMSAITLLGTPAEVYQFGTMYWLIGASYFIVMPATNYLYLPIFYKLQVTSAYEYLELRFHKVIRCLGSATFTIQMSLYMSVVVYAPALALSQVTGINVYVSVTAIFLVCIFYTVVGGMKAVMWTDTLQVIIMYGAMIAVVAKGHVDVGGLSAVWNANQASGRVEFSDFDVNPGKRHSVWSLVVGGYFTWITIYGVNQSQVQRYLTVSTMKQARDAVWINLVGLFVLLAVCCYGGMVIFAKYADCDPLSAKYVDNPAQLFPLFVMDTLGHIPGVPGLFVAGIFSGALSTVSSGLNSLAAICLEDFVRPFCCTGMTDARATNVSKGLAMGFGLLCFGLVFVASQLGNVLEAALSIFGIIGGPLLGVFTLGIFFPWANAIGAGVGILSGLGVMLWIGIGTQVAKAHGFLKLETKPYSIEGCRVINETLDTTLAELGRWMSSTMASPQAQTEEEPLSIYHLSYMWYSTVGCFTVIIVGLIVSAITGLQDPRKLNPGLICNTGETIYWFLPKNMKEFLRFQVGDDYIAVEDQQDVCKEESNHKGDEINPVFVSSDTHLDGQVKVEKSEETKL
ncbi:sodium-coupled monocarboxylate transporter 1-like [Daphnia pulicaria]|uniref:sodium-coupled monocarboxylate transporter 1-like n=1 Tax=Daphnia pulicaria TaxID=35523 RepID=UPI001EEB3021|nr:sodium-coupled monocarboxylate transporter 1-like [Daphnia pulicaria]XP_046639503.1 sodium-coupled monocarboxylate transporter 1-like [Daphnia pulicaria]